MEGSGKSIRFSLIALNVASAASPRGKPVILGSPKEVPDTHRYLNDKSLGEGPALDYPVPSCAPARPDNVRAEHSFFSAVSRAIVYPRNWQIRIEQYVSIDGCQGGMVPDIAIFEAGFAVVDEFALDDNLVVHLKGDHSLEQEIREGPTLCSYTGSECQYNAVSMGSIPMGPIAAVSAKPYLGSLILTVASHELGVPSLSWSAPSCRESPASKVYAGLPVTPRTDQ